jgi:hypothetical protein
MDATQRAQLVDRIVTTWPNGPKGVIWTETLTDHDDITFTAALDVYKHLRDTVERNNPPSIALYLATWRARWQRTPAEHARPDNDGPAMSFDEYYATLIRSADTGHTDATRMLDLWTDNERRGLIGSWLR